MCEEQEVTIRLSRELKQTLEWMTNPSTSQKVPKYVQKGMDEFKRQVTEQVKV